jgi:hypothetical protein
MQLTMPDLSNTPKWKNRHCGRLTKRDEVWFFGTVGLVIELFEQ